MGHRDAGAHVTNGTAQPGAKTGIVTASVNCLVILELRSDDGQTAAGGIVNGAAQRLVCGPRGVSTERRIGDEIAVGDGESAGVIDAATQPVAAWSFAARSVVTDLAIGQVQGAPFVEDACSAVGDTE